MKITVEPDGDADVTVTLAGGRACGTAGAVCTRTGDPRPLSNSPSATVIGPPALAVADAEAREGTDDTIAFEVTLSRAAAHTVTVDYATADGTASAGEDYAATSGTLTFAAGNTRKTVAVAVLDDAKDESEERFTLTLSNASGAVIADGEATGIIENDDPMPAAWLARFGRTVGSQVVDAVTARLEEGGGTHVTVGGQNLAAGGAAPDEVENRDEFYCPHIVAIVRLLMLTGCRLGEVLALEWDWIKGKRIHLPDSKSGPRTVWLSNPARAVIDAIPRYGSDCPFLFPARPPTRHIDTIQRQWERIRNEAGLPGLRNHDLRHSWASTAAMNGVDMVTVAKLLGHALVETTERYTHLSDQSVADAADRVSNRIHAALAGRGAEREGGTGHANR